jgi:hypothetical protein
MMGGCSALAIAIWPAQQASKENKNFFIAKDVYICMLYQ